jgi:hypothetical protein
MAGLNKAVEVGTHLDVVDALGRELEHVSVDVASVAERRVCLPRTRAAAVHLVYTGSVARGCSK